MTTRVGTQEGTEDDSRRPGGRGQLGAAGGPVMTESIGLRLAPGRLFSAGRAVV